MRFLTEYKLLFVFAMLLCCCSQQKQQPIEVQETPKSSLNFNKLLNQPVVTENSQTVENEADTTSVQATTTPADDTTQVNNDPLAQQNIETEKEKSTIHHQLKAKKLESSEPLTMGVVLLEEESPNFSSETTQRESEIPTETQASPKVEAVQTSESQTDSEDPSEKMLVEESSKSPKAESNNITETAKTNETTKAVVVAKNTDVSSQEVVTQKSPETKVVPKAVEISLKQSAPPVVTPVVPEWLQKFTPRIGKYNYKIFIDGEVVGHQKVTIAKQQDTITINSELAFSANFLLFFSFYQKHTCDEVWKNNSLSSISSWTDNNGDELNLNLQQKNGKMFGKGPEGDINTSVPLVTNNAFNLVDYFQNNKSVAIMNPQTGTIRQLSLVSKGNKRLKIAGTNVPCKHLHFEDSSWEFWFSESGILLKQQDSLYGYIVEIVLESWEN